MHSLILGRKGPLSLGEYIRRIYLPTMVLFKGRGYDESIRLLNWVQFYGLFDLNPSLYSPRIILLLMGFLSNIYFPLVILLLSCSYLPISTAVDTITSAQPINDTDVIISNGGIFKLGFFSPKNSTHRYLGIWFNNLPVVNVIWVANRDRPLNDSSGIVAISDSGNLLVLSGKNEVLWSSNVSESRANSSAKLLDSGNLVLQDNTSGMITWGSFQEPYDSFVPKMTISTSSKEEVRMLTSWKSPSDPTTGTFSLGIHNPDAPEIFIWNGSRRYWRSGPWNGRKFIGIPIMDNLYLDGYNIAVDKEGTISQTFTYANESVRRYYLLTSQGELVEKYWENGMKDFMYSWDSHQTECDVYGMCGAFGSCDPTNSPICSCLRGYQPRNVAEWNTGNWSSGCFRSTPLKCERRESGGGVEGEEDGFLQLTTMKVPDFSERLADLDDQDQCRSHCLSNCSCTAYAYDTDIGCLSWSGNLIDIQKFSYRGLDLYIHVAHSALDEEKKGKNIAVTVTISVIIVTITTLICAFLAWKWMAKRKGVNFWKMSKETELEESLNKVNIKELPIFKFEKVQTATNNFHLDNKLGEGGFGPVYKGKWVDGQEIAVKRLVKSSGQGLKEFMTEVEVISKLQHRNLVRLLGCCVDGDEKMLIYEYLPNKSLDSILFDSYRRKELDWKKRFNIIEGVSRGLLYLHRDSRLRIIHRDIKASNILLDESLNPKISDFGTARIFGGNQDKGNTIKVVGTFGYMSPEYAMQGRFSEKSDLFSFGVLVLEIVSGRKNTSFYGDEQSLSLLEHAWKLWNEGNIMILVDQTISDPTRSLDGMEILRCIHVGLLCVQELAKDRPNVSIVVSMLNSEIAELPTPKQPPFIQGHIAAAATDLSSQQYSVGSVTATTMEPR